MFYNLLFRIILWGLGLRLRWLGKHNEKFREKIKTQDFILQFRTFDGKAARAYHFRQGAVQPLPGLQTAPTVTLSFLDAHFAINTLSAAGKDQTIMMRAMSENKIKAEGDISKIMVFMQVAKYLGPQKKKTVAEST